jgi:hypothetical protein
VTDWRAGGAVQEVVETLTVRSRLPVGMRNEGAGVADAGTDPGVRQHDYRREQADQV